MKVGFVLLDTSLHTTSGQRHQISALQWAWLVRRISRVMCWLPGMRPADAQRAVEPEPLIDAFLSQVGPTAKRKNQKTAHQRCKPTGVTDCKTQEGRIMQKSALRAVFVPAADLHSLLKDKLWRVEFGFPSGRLATGPACLGRCVR